jgi:predicted CoA-substrate-specific enzyme activase
MADVRTLGIDIGAETIKIAEIVTDGDQARWARREIREHAKEPAPVLTEMLAGFDWTTVGSAAVTGRMSRQINLPRIPIKQAQMSGFEFLVDPGPATVVSIGSHGFSVLELRSSHVEVFRENSRCSQGTGNFLRQLIERFDMTVEQASEICERVKDPAPLSGRCPVILKTDMTHLANKGEPRERILAGLYDAVCENVQVLIKPRVSPGRVALIGGVARSSRIREHFRRFLDRYGMELLAVADDDGLFFEAVGCAAIAAEQQLPPPPLAELIGREEDHEFDAIPPLHDFLDRVQRLAPRPKPPAAQQAPLILGFDIGSTGSKIVALDTSRGETAWEGYVNTNGAPVKAAQTLMQKFVDSDHAARPVLAVGATGSGREIVGSLMSTCYGSEAVFVLNEIAAHAEGALHYDPRVDTIFEIGGQDAKYIRLAGGRVIDAAMNEACSAGTGSFIEEQGKKFSGIEDVVQLGTEALGATRGVSLGQHCSVFMAEIIDGAVAAGTPQRAIVAGIYDSIIQNYLNRVKGSRSVGSVIFCQGMPFSSDALAAAVARQTGSEVIVPPNPGTVGALGIALLTHKELYLEQSQPLDPHRFLAAEVIKKDVFVCKSKKGCGGAGNRCRIDRIRTLVDGVEQKFTWGGGCSRYDKGTGKRKLPDRAPDPFREREGLFQAIRERLSQDRGNATVALTDEFTLKSLFPFFATFVYELGFDPVFHTGADQATLKRGIEDANVPFCAPMQQYHGLASQMAEGQPDYLLMPMLRHIPRVKDEPWARLCPIVQASPDVLKWDLGLDSTSQIVSPVINVGRDGLESQLFQGSCQALAAELGVGAEAWRPAYDAALAVQNEFDDTCLELGQRALDYCAEQEITPIVVLGRTYTIYNTVLNSNVPTILREQGSIAIPVDCYPVSDETPIFHRMYWGYGQRNLRAAHQIRRTSGVYSIYCSNYSCGPDSFNVHFYGYIMAGKPFSIIETDGHSGDAGTKTRVEAFLYCVHEDQRSDFADNNGGRDFKALHEHSETVPGIEERNAIVLIPRMGQSAEILAGALRGLGLRAECLPMPDSAALELGRRHTSGKECVPMTLTLGSLLQRLEREPSAHEQFAFFMPTANGPCRFGSYHGLHKIVLDRLGWRDRVSIWSPVDEDYFGDVSGGFSALTFSALVAGDLLLAALYDTRPVEAVPGEAKEIYDFYFAELLELTERETQTNPGNGTALAQVLSGNMWGVTDLLRRAIKAFEAIRDDRDLPTVLVVGEIYVRCDPFANNFVIDKLERRGIRCRFAAFNEWIEYTDYQDTIKSTLGELVTGYVQAAIQNSLYNLAAPIMGWQRRTTVQDSLLAAKPYIREQLSGEAVLTLGGPVHEWREGQIDGVVSVGPLECMPNKISEAQFFHVAEHEGLHSLSLYLNGDPIDPEVIDNFAYEIHVQHNKRKQGHSLPPPPPKPRAIVWKPHSKVNLREP